MNNIRIIKNGIDVHRVCEQLSIYSDDWYIQREGTDTLLERGYADIEVLACGNGSSSKSQCHPPFL